MASTFPTLSELASRVMINEPKLVGGDGKPGSPVRGVHVEPNVVNPSFSCVEPILSMHGDVSGTMSYPLVTNPIMHVVGDDTQANVHLNAVSYVH